jgi:galactose mutarotase-like enzyme
VNNKYIGHHSQVFGVTESRLTGGKADGMRVLEVRNGKGLEFTVSLDRGADIPYLFYKGNSMAYIAPCGMVGPKYYDNKGTNFLKSFTAGFITTCGLTAVGSPCTDVGEELPLHGDIANTPSESHSYSYDEESITITATVRDAYLFGRQLVLTRKYICSLKENTLTLIDTVENVGPNKSPYMVLYHCNMGYPLLSENAVLNISSEEVGARNEHSLKDIDTWDKILPPTADFEEQCYYHTIKGTPKVSLKNPDINTELTITYDNNALDCFTQWKMLGDYQYAMGLEPGNCYPDGRDVMREKGILKFLNPGEKAANTIKFTFTDI